MLFAVVAVIYLIAMGASVAMYILYSLGIYTVAQRRGIRHPWMAWLPVTNLWILGSISDQYQYATQGKIRSRRKVMLGLCIAIAALLLLFFFAYMGVLLRAFMSMSEPELTIMQLLPELLWVLAICAVAMVLAIILTVFQSICLHNLYASCDPNNKNAYTVLSILLNITMPFLVFFSRKKDLGMPPRKVPVQNLPEDPNQI